MKDAIMAAAVLFAASWSAALGEDVLFRRDFEDGKTQALEIGTLTSQNTFAKTKYSLKAAGAGEPMRIKWDSRLGELFKTRADMVVSFAYFLSEDAKVDFEIWSGTTNDYKVDRLNIGTLVAKRWQHAVVEYSSTKGANEDVIRINFFVRSGTAEFLIDDFTVSSDTTLKDVGKRLAKESKDAVEAAPAKGDEAAEAPGVTVLFQRDFEDGKTQTLEIGALTSQNTFAKTKYSLKAAGAGEPMRIKWDSRLGKLFRTAADMTVSFAYFISEDAEVELVIRSGTADNNKQNRPALGKLEKGLWKLKVINYAPGGVDDEVLRIDFFVKSATAEFLIDNFTVSSGGTPADIQRRLEEERRILAQFTRDPEKDGVAMSHKIIKNIAKLRRPGAKPKTIMLIGGVSVVSLEAMLRQSPLVKQQGHTIIGSGSGFLYSSPLITSRYVAEQREKLAAALEKHKPEVVLIIFDYKEIECKIKAEEAGRNITEILSACWAAGAVPIVSTMAVNGSALAAEKLDPVTAYNAAVRALAKDNLLPFLDLYFILNSEEEAKRLFFSTFTPNEKGYGKILEKLLDLHGIIEKMVLRPQPEKDAGPEPEGAAKAAPEPEGKKRE